MTELWLHMVFALGGGLGAVLRHFVGQKLTHELPLATLVVNVIGCLLLGFWAAQLGAGGREISEEERRLVFGFCGGFTTFSSFAYQTLELHRGRTIVSAAGNIGLSIVLCAVGYLLGMLLASAF